MGEIARTVAAITAEAGQLAMARFRTDFRRWEKGPGDPVSEVDLAVDEFLRERLSALLPDAGWLSEETADRAERLACNRVWVVDPIDGTRDYIRGRPGWCVSVALVEAGIPVIAVLDAPARGETCLATAGGGAWRGGARLRSGDRTELQGARVPADALPRAERDLFVAVAKPNSIALRLAMVAADEADLVATARWGNEWDVAAAALIASEAGATVTDALGAALVFNQPRPQAFGVLVAGAGLHGAALARLGERAGAEVRTVSSADLEAPPPSRGGGAAKP